MKPSLHNTKNAKLKPRSILTHQARTHRNPTSKENRTKNREEHIPNKIRRWEKMEELPRLGDGLGATCSYWRR